MRCRKLNTKNFDEQFEKITILHTGYYDTDVDHLQPSFEHNKAIVTRSQVTFRRAIIMFPM